MNKGIVVIGKGKSLLTEDIAKYMEDITVISDSNSHGFELEDSEKEYLVSDSMLTSAAHVALLAGLMSNNKLDKDSKSKRSMRMGEEVRLHLHSGAHMDVVVVGQDYRYITGRRIIKTEPAKKRKMVTIKVSDIASFTSLDEDMKMVDNMMDNVVNGGSLNG